MKKSIAMYGDLMVFQDDFGLPQLEERRWMIDDKASAAARAPRTKHRRWRFRRLGELLARLGAWSELGCPFAPAADAAPDQELSYAYSTRSVLGDALRAEGEVCVAAAEERARFSNNGPARAPGKNRTTKVLRNREPKST
jgi:hypothetical protein